MEKKKYRIRIIRDFNIWCATIDTPNTGISSELTEEEFLNYKETMDRFFYWQEKLRKDNK